MTRGLRASLLLTLVVLAACQGAPSPPGASPRGMTPARVTPKPAAASQAPAASPGMPGTPTPAAARYLAKPSAPVRTITGAVTIDSRYAVDAGAGRIVSNNGANVIALGNGLVSDAGGSLISDAGGGLVSKTRGANLISDQGGQLKADWGRGYRLAADERPSLGTLAPAAGMAIRAYDLASGAFLALGAMPDGGPAYEILSDAQGAYVLYLPEASRTVMLLARPPGRADARLTYGLLLGRKPITTSIDEDSAKATRFIRRGYVRAWVDNLSLPKASPSVAPVPSATATPAGTPAPVASRDPRIAAGWKRVAELAASSGAQRLSDAARLAVAERIADVELAYSDPATTMIVRASTLFPYDGPDETVFDAYVGVMKTYREAITERMRALAARGEDPEAYFAKRPYVVAANAGRAEPYVIKKPADFLDFMVDHYFLNTSQSYAETAQGMAEVLVDQELPVEPVGRLFAALAGSQADADRVFWLEDTGAFDVVETLIIEAGRAAP